jgi:hypothetical protein
VIFTSRGVFELLDIMAVVVPDDESPPPEAREPAVLVSPPQRAARSSEPLRLLALFGQCFVTS